MPFLGQECSLGYAPTSLERTGGAALRRPRRPVRRRRLSADRSVTLTGWAGDMQARQPAREVIATFNGKIVGRATPDIERPDVPAAGYPAGFLGSGFQLTIPTWANASKELKVFAIGRDGSVSQLAVLNQPPSGGVAKIGSRTVRLQQNIDVGHVDAESAAGGRLESSRPPGPRGGTTAGSRSMPRALAFSRAGSSCPTASARTTRGA